MTPPKLSIGLVQMSARTQRDENLAHAITGLREAVQRGAKIICLQELFALPYFCQTENEAHFQLAEPLIGPTTQTMAQMAKELGVVVIAPLFERRCAGLYHNTAVVLGPDGKHLGTYRKLHIPHDPQYYEKYYFAPGDLGVVVVDTPFARIAPLICYDQWFPETARLATLGGADILFYPTAIGWLPDEKDRYGGSQLSAWQAIQQSHAIANGTFVAAVNRTGSEGEYDTRLEFWGHSFVCGPFGEILGQAGSEEQVLVVECNLGVIDAVRRSWPFLRDRRIDVYGGLTQRLLDG
ncbi:carbon-nitrogen hydrolase [Myxococcota bacterium]